MTRGPDVAPGLAALAVIHPLPSALNAGLVVALALVASADLVVAATLALGMFGYQASIGALNDLVDAVPDSLAKPDAPIPAGLVSTRMAWAVVVVGGALGSAVSAGFGVAVLAVGTAGYACGLAYDLTPRRGDWGWLCFALAIPLLLVWTWLAAAGTLPPAWPILLLLAAVAGPALHLSNSMVDIDADHRAGTASLATRLGHQRARIVLAWLVITILGLGWATLLWLGEIPMASAALAGTATLLAGPAVWLSWRPGARAREMGWLGLAAALALLAVAWVSAVAA